MKPIQDPCEQPKESGPCEGNFTRWFFNAESQACEQFNYGGCKANGNNFATEIACHQQCLQPGRRRGMYLKSIFHLRTARIMLEFFLPELGLPNRDTFQCFIYKIEDDIKNSVYERWRLSHGGKKL